ncbi:MAG TPA: ubiquitin-like small modifier protein 1 [Actinomycetales bacterium]|nr:ubiquitin-like small modifier protein 1 [Actinomycetales bacterium]
MRAVVLLPGVLREHAAGRDRLEVDLPDDARVGAVLELVSEEWPVLGRRLRDDTGAIRKHVNVFVDGEDVRRTGGLTTPVPDGAVVHVLPSVAGG